MCMCWPTRPSLACGLFMLWARLALPWTLVTDDGADRAELKKFRDAGVAVEVAAVPGAAEAS